MKPPLGVPHGTSLGTTAGITAVIALIVAVSLLGQCASATGVQAFYANAALVAIVLGAALLYTSRHWIGVALDGAADPRGAVAGARGLACYHAGMAALFVGVALAVGVRFAAETPAAWVISVVALAAAASAIVRALSWWTEARRRERETPPLARQKIA